MPSPPPLPLSLHRPGPWAPQRLVLGPASRALHGIQSRGGEACGPAPEPVTKKRPRVDEDDDPCGDPHIISPDMEVVVYHPIPLHPCTPPPGLPPPPPGGKGERKDRRPPKRSSARGPPATGGTRHPEGPDDLEELSSGEEVVSYIMRADAESDAKSRAEGKASRIRPRTPPLLVPDSDPDPVGGVDPEFGSADASVSPDARPASGDPETGGDRPGGASGPAGSPENRPGSSGSGAGGPPPAPPPLPPPRGPSSSMSRCLPAARRRTTLRPPLRGPSSHTPRPLPSPHRLTWGRGRGPN